MYYFLHNFILLKYTFAIPLNSALNVKGFIFPSGYMSSSVVFYGWFFANIRHSLLRIIIVVILTGIGFLLIYKGYHYPFNIIASITIGIMVIAFVYRFNQRGDCA